MMPRPAHQLFYDSEATLRLVADALDELRLPSATPPPVEPGKMETGARTDRCGMLAELPEVLLRAYGEITGVLGMLRRSRDVLERTTVEKLRHTSVKLQEVSSTTELAATDMLDGLERALVLVDELETGGGAGDTKPAADLRDDLRDELFALMNCLQFQDITTQQLNYASSVLIDMEHRLAELARLFDPEALGIDPAALTAGPGAAFDPGATTVDAQNRQALVDQIFGER